MSWIKKINISNIYILLTLIVCAVNVYGQSDSVRIKGHLINSFTKDPIVNFEVILSKKYGTQIKTTTTDKNGNFEFIDLISKSFLLILSDSGFIEKSIYSKDSTSIVNFEIRLRPKNQSHSYHDIDSTIIGSKIKLVLNKFTLDNTDINEIHEPPFISRGFDFELGDSTIVYIFTERFPIFRRNERKWLNQKVIGVGISRVDGTTNYYGDGRPFIIRLSNKYLIE